MRTAYVFGTTWIILKGISVQEQKVEGKGDYNYSHANDPTIYQS